MKFSKTHEWVEVNGNIATVGLTAYAAEELGDIVYVNEVAVGTDVTIGKAFTDVESVKAVSDVMSPVSGKVTEFNTQLIDAPEAINEDALKAWIVKVELGETDDELMTEEEYKKLIEQNA